MATPCEAAIRDHLRQSQDALARAASDNVFIAAIEASALLIEKSLAAGGKLLIAGNGGSASDAQHIAAELIGRYKRDRASMAAIALTTDTSALTAIGNDYGFDHIFARQLQGLGRKGDVFLGISTSGRSPNVVAALKTARELGLSTIGFAGENKKEFGPLCDVLLSVPSPETALVQQLHITAAHAICGYLEK
ncbi:MAG: D-sedoheptulose 7-phosphate isomerase [Pseudolabrys sp.]